MFDVSGSSQRYLALDAFKYHSGSCPATIMNERRALNNWNRGPVLSLGHRLSR